MIYDTTVGRLFIFVTRYCAGEPLIQHCRTTEYFSFLQESKTSIQS